jgi:hypothetical protein
MSKFEENVVLDDIAKKVDNLVTGKTQEIDGKLALKRFQEMVEEYGRRKDSYKKKASEYCDERCKNVQKLRDNKRLQDKIAGPPGKSYTWRRENMGFFNPETNKIELLSGWMPTSTIQVPEDPEIWKNYGEHKDISSLIPEILLLNQYFLLAVCHDCFMGVELRPLIITKEMANKYENGLGLYYTGHGYTKCVQQILEGKYEKFLESAYDDVLHDLESRQIKTSAETGKGKVKQSKARPGRPVEAEIALIRDTLDAKAQAKEEEIAELKTKVSVEETQSKEIREQLEVKSAEINTLKLKSTQIEESKKQQRALLGYFGLLALVILVAVLSAFLVNILLPQVAKIIGTWPTRLLGGILAFAAGHLVLECCVKGKERMTKLWPFKQIRKFRKGLWAIVIVGFIGGVLGNLYANHIQKNLDQPATEQGAKGDAVTREPHP